MVQIGRRVWLPTGVLVLFIFAGVTAIFGFLFNRYYQSITAELETPPKQLIPEGVTLENKKKHIYEIVGKFFQAPALQKDVVMGVFVINNGQSIAQITVILGSPNETIELGKYQPDNQGGFSGNATFTKVKNGDITKLITPNQPAVIRFFIPEYDPLLPENKILANLESNAQQLEAFVSTDNRQPLSFTATQITGIGILE